jgi:polysaccharide deacetylase 2 family uncharacterized protein YibQ
MDRRDFLSRTTVFLLGSFLGFNPFSKSQASESQDTSFAAQSRIALIIDDIGANLSHATPFLDLGIPITFAVLPRLAKSQEAAEIIHTEGHEIMLHQPMEPIDRYLDPGPGALYVGYGSNKITRIMEENISQIPFAIGVNNHMGSRFTTYPKEVLETLQVVKERGLFFVDSLTINRSMAYKTARDLHMPAAERDFFLDNVLEEPAILRQLYGLKKYSLKHGQAVGIGHPFRETASAIQTFLTDNKESGIEWVHISSLIKTA